MYRSGIPLVRLLSGLATRRYRRARQARASPPGQGEPARPGRARQARASPACLCRLSILSPRAAAPRGNAARQARPASAGASARRPWRSPRMAYETAKGGDACRSVCPAALAIASSAPDSCIREIPSPPAPPVRVSACALPERRPLGRTAGIGPCGRTTARPPSSIVPLLPTPAPAARACTFFRLIFGPRPLFWLIYGILGI